MKLITHIPIKICSAEWNREAFHDAGVVVKQEFGTFVMNPQTVCLDEPHMIFFLDALMDASCQRFTPVSCGVLLDDHITLIFNGLRIERNDRTSFYQRVNNS